MHSLVTLRARFLERTQQSLPSWHARPFTAHGGLRVLLVSLNNPISQSQIFPFHFYRKSHSRPIQLREVHLDALTAFPDRAPSHADVVLFQTWIDKSDADMVALTNQLKALNPSAKVVFVDSFAPTDLRYAAVLNDRVDLYIKKHVLRDRSHYNKPTAGPTNLTDFYGRHYQIPEPPTQHAVPSSFLDKLVVGPSFFLAPYLLTRLHGPWPGHRAGNRRHQLHARLGGTGQSDWYQRMRTDALNAVKNLSGVRTTPFGQLSKRAYMAELGNSMTCFSPFGYGEVCWRDYEAVAMGAALIKPDMAHIETAPDVFIPHQTYLPVSWTFEDLGEAVARLINHPTEVERLSKAAFDVLAGYCQGDGFHRHMQQVLAS